MTERSETERAELVALADRLAVFTKYGPSTIFEQHLSGNQLQLIVTALRSLAAPAPVAANASADGYRNAIDEALVTRFIGVAKGDARAELNQIIKWEVAVALDPLVSSDAQALIDQGRNASAEARLREALEHYAKEYCEGWCEQDAGCAQFDHDCGGCLARRALSQHPHASDCDKQGER